MKVGTQDVARGTSHSFSLLPDILRQRRFLPSARMKASSACSVAVLHSAQPKPLLLKTKTKIDKAV